MSRDWIEMYLEYTRHQVSPEIYHRWVALGVLGAAMERRVWLTRGYEELRVYPGQLMVVLVGRSALQKKTTACNLGTKMLKHLPGWLFNPLPKKTSPQQLLHDLARVDEDGSPLAYPGEAGPKLVGRRVNSSGFINAGELATFFSTDSWNEMLAATINDLNDAESGKREVKFRKWKAELWNPIVGMVGAVTPKGIAEELPKAARTAGFFGRVLWVYSASTDRKNALTELIPENVALKKRLREGISQIAAQYGPFQYTKQGKKWFEDWYDEYHAELTRQDQLGVLDTSGYWGRKDAHLLRVAMCCTASRTWGAERFLRREDLQRAAGYLREIEKGFGQAMAEIGVGPQSEENRRLVNFVEARGERYTEAWVPEIDIVRFANTLGWRRFQLDDALSRLGDLSGSHDLEHKFIKGKRHWRKVWTSGALVRRAQEERG